MTTQQGTEDYTYDVFISYSTQDRAWVQDVLLATLESNGLKVCIDYHSFAGGEVILNEIMRAIERSRKTLLILTPNYLESRWTRLELFTLQTIDPMNEQRRFLVMHTMNCDLPSVLRAFIYADFIDPANHAMAWRRVFEFLQTPLPQQLPPGPRSLPSKEISDDQVPILRTAWRELRRCQREVSEWKNLHNMYHDLEWILTLLEQQMIPGQDYADVNEFFDRIQANWWRAGSVVERIVSFADGDVIIFECESERRAGVEEIKQLSSHIKETLSEQKTARTTIEIKTIDFEQERALPVIQEFWLKAISIWHKLTGVKNRLAKDRETTLPEQEKARTALRNLWLEAIDKCRSELYLIDKSLLNAANALEKRAERISLIIGE